MKGEGEQEGYSAINLRVSVPGAAREKRAPGEAEVRAYGAVERGETAAEAGVIARQIFNARAERINLVDYAIEYTFAEGYAGGDIVDVYEFDNGSVAFSGADVEGRGPRAALLAALIKFSLRAYSSGGLSPEATVQNLNRLYLEHCAFEKVHSFASVFFAHVDHERNTMGYCSAGHDIAFLAHPDETPVLLPVTAPIIGVFSGQFDLFRQRFTELKRGTILVIGTDGITESRDASGELYGNDRILKIIDRERGAPMAALSNAIISDALAFAGGAARDDIAVLAARFT